MIFFLWDWDVGTMFPVCSHKVSNAVPIDVPNVVFGNQGPIATGGMHDNIVNKKPWPPKQPPNCYY